MPHRFIPLVDPIVRHGLMELRSGAPILHTLREVALMAALVGAGETPSRAIRAIERREPALIGTHPGEAAETMFHPGFAQPGVTVPYTGMMPYGWAQQMPMTTVPWGAGGYMPMGMWQG